MGSGSRYGLILAAAVFLGGCASLRGGPEPITEADITATTHCPSDQDVTAYYQSDNAARGGLTPEQWRDAKISSCIDIIDAKYAEFQAELRRQIITSNLGTDLAVIGLGGIGSVASKGVSNALSAASAGLVGAKAAIDKDIYFQQTLPALLSAMTANRNTVYLRIRQKQTGPGPYSLADARADIRTYQAAGNIDEAIKGLTATAAKAEAVSADRLASFGVRVLEPKESDRQTKMANYIRGLVVAADVDKLTKIAKALDLPVAAGATAQKIGNDIRFEIVHRINLGKIDDVYAALAPVAGADAQEFAP